MNGLFVPVVYVVLKDKGFDIAHVGALVLFSSLATILFGIPCGMIGDRFGRKQVFIVGELLFLLFAAGVMYFQSFPGIAACMVCAGLSAAMMAGSLDGIFVERLGIYGATPTTIQASIGKAGTYQMGGIFAGAIAASLLLFFDPEIPGVYRFEFNYLCVALLMPLLIALTYFLIPASVPAPTISPCTADQIGSLGRLHAYLNKFAKRDMLLYLMLSSALSAAAAMSFEKFWQLKLAAFVGIERADWIFGVIFAASMLLGMCGNLLSLRICNLLGNNYTKVLILTRILLAAVFVGLHLSSALPTFVVLFCLVFLVSSVSASPSMALFHH